MALLPGASLEGRRAISARRPLFHALLVGALLLLRAVAASGQAGSQTEAHAEHSAVLEVGGAVSVDLADTSFHFGASLAVETTVIENWLELELGVSAVRGGDGSELAASLLFKKPWRLSDRAEFMLGVGPELSHPLEPHGGASPGVVVVLDFMFWPSKDIGWYFEPAYEVVFHGGARHGLGATGGLLIGF